MLKYNGTFIDELKHSILGASKDLFRAFSETLVEFKIEDDKIFYLMYGKSDERRNLDPLKFSDETQWCFCKLNSNQLKDAKKISEFSNLWIDRKKHKAIQYSSACGPEPSKEHYVDLFRLAEEIDSENIIIVVNLNGSGASMPQHFHTQIIPISYNSDSLTSQNIISSLLDNLTLDLNKTKRITDQKITINEIVFPIWGIQFIFGGEFNAQQKGKLLYRAIQEKIRYATQLHLSYNIIIRTSESNKVTVLLRETQKEKPFQSEDIFNIIKNLTDLATAETIRDSYNSMWRWGWLECIGGFPARDESFSDVCIFDDDFWKQVFDFVSVKDDYRNQIRQHVELGLKIYQPK